MDPEHSRRQLLTSEYISNGNFIDTEGRVVTCEHATSSITRMEPDGRYMKTLASHYDGKQLNSPNDVIVDSQGRIWFTDPMYGRTSPVAGIKRDGEMGFQGVYCIKEDGNACTCEKDFEQPNGLCMEIGEKTMLVNDTPRQEIRRFKVEDDCTLSGGEVICGGRRTPDGTKIDKDGNIFTTATGDVTFSIKTEKNLERSMCRDSVVTSASVVRTEIICILRARQSIV